MLVSGTKWTFVVSFSWKSDQNYWNAPFKVSIFRSLVRYWHWLFRTDKSQLNKTYTNGSKAERLSANLIFGKIITKTRLLKYTENFSTKKWKISDENSDIFHISAQNIDCGYSLEPPRGSNEYPQSMFLSRNKKNNVYPCKPQFYYIKVGFKGVKII